MLSPVKPHMVAWMPPWGSCTGCPLTEYPAYPIQWTWFQCHQNVHSGIRPVAYHTMLLFPTNSYSGQTSWQRIFPATRLKAAMPHTDSIRTLTPGLLNSPFFSSSQVNPTEACSRASKEQRREASHHSSALQSIQCLCCLGQFLRGHRTD